MDKPIERPVVHIPDVDPLVYNETEKRLTQKRFCFYASSCDRQCPSCVFATSNLESFKEWRKLK